MNEIPILVDDNDVLIVNKPSGIAMHDSANIADTAKTENAKSTGAGKNIRTGESADSGSLRNIDSNIDTHTLGIVSLLRKQTGYSQLHLCHRLDTGTSGCLCLAKNAQTAALIGDSFETRQVSKYYLAISADKPKKKQGTIVGDMKNRRGGQFMLLKSKDNPAVTQFFSQSAKPGYRGFIVKPLTGKTHQIRVALKSVGAAILGDTLYSGAPSDRLHLHAGWLSIPLPSRTISVKAPILEGDLFTDSEVATWLAELPEPDTFNWPEIAPSLLQLVSKA
ncbi:pseudouridine synthase [Alteromonas sp. CI.11.F.A3]|uniref:pseudouridine synthase n=1 Tax=Alteromonas sp. CI.11.F.A3 TaxID=3079555 RepID=UPI00294316B8|nr:pseudouridine synthase [Alteromonas sp. CI.11.F.A3]WOI36524.1 pseudouridine synthase [Alteromonas sp. CI.11.F.A3]